jgi:hypothetical protein
MLKKGPKPKLEAFLRFGTELHLDRLEDFLCVLRARSALCHPHHRSLTRRIMRTKPKIAFLGALGLIAALCLPAQQQPARDDAENARGNSGSLADLSPENRALFDAVRDAAEQGRDADVLADGRKLLPALKPDSPLANFITQVTAGAAIETGDTSDALTLIKPLADAHPKDWHAAALLARAYAESGDQALRDQQIAHLLDLHKQTSDPDFAKLHIFPIQKVKLRSGYAVFLYPFEPLKPYNTYLVALIYTSDGKADFRLELGSEDADQAFFKPKKPGERRFSIDSYRKNQTNEKWPETQALYGFVDGVFDYDRMRDLMVKAANGEALPRK